jgi:aspartate racemase
MLGILGGMGPAATVDFMAKLVRLTPADCDQAHIPLLLSSLPQTPDRSAAILGTGPSPLPMLLVGLQRLIDGGAQAVVIPCNSSHHWFDQLQGHSAVPLLHIADATLEALATQGQAGPVVLLATRGTLRSGFYQRKLEGAGYPWLLPTLALQAEVDAAISGIKEGAPDRAALALGRVWQDLAAVGVRAAILACTELPVAAELLPPPAFPVLDSNLELARASVAYALASAWIRPQGAIRPAG